MDDAARQKWFEQIWADREERIYPAFFGDLGPGIYTIPPATFESLGKTDPDPRYLTHGVFECPPNSQRPSWAYVTSGMSNPWGEDPESVEPNSYSGLGFEFTLHTPERARWPIQVLHWVMAVQLLVAAGELQGHLLERNDRIPLGGSLGKKDGSLTHLLVTEPAGLEEGGYLPEFRLVSGRVDVMLLVGITRREAEFAGTQGADALVKLLRHHEVFPLSDPERITLV